MIANDSMNGSGAISCGINSGITNLPAGFTHRAILVIQNGINRTFDTLGNALTVLFWKGTAGKRRCSGIEQTGGIGRTTARYITYNFDSAKVDIRERCWQFGMNLPAKALSSWVICNWTGVGGIPRGRRIPGSGSGNLRGGILSIHRRAGTVHGNGLASFQTTTWTAARDPFCRWIDPASPVSNYNICDVNQRFWDNRFQLTRRIGRTGWLICIPAGLSPMNRIG